MFYYKIDNGNYVADMKHKYIVNIADQAKQCSNISRIVLFGSALETRCTEKSDIDIAVFGEESKANTCVQKNSKIFKDACSLSETVFIRITIFCIFATAKQQMMPLWETLTRAPKSTGGHKNLFHERISFISSNVKSQKHGRSVLTAFFLFLHNVYWLIMF